MPSIEDLTKRIKLKSRIEAETKYTHLDEHLNEYIRLDHETTLAIYRSIQAKNLWGPPFGYQIKPHAPFVNHEFGDKFADHFAKLSSILEKNQNEEVLLFPYDWELIGCLALKMSVLIENFNQHMLFFEDEIRLYLPDFSNALLLYGERYGTGDELNLLYMSIAGQQWGLSDFP